jgi:hypothetical protein
MSQVELFHRQLGDLLSGRFAHTFIFCVAIVPNALDNLSLQFDVPARQLGGAGIRRHLGNEH